MYGSQGRFSSDHPVSHSPQASAWDQVSSLAALRHAVLTKPARATTLLKCELTDQLGEGQELEATSISPQGSILAVAGHELPRFHSVRSGHLQLPANAVGPDWSSSGAWAPCGTKYAFCSGVEGPTPWVESQVVQVLGCQGQSVEVYCLPRRDGLLGPDIAWSACSQHVAWTSLGANFNGPSGRLHVYSLGSFMDAPTVRRDFWLGAWAWHPRKAQLVYISRALSLTVLSLEAAQAQLVCEVSLASVFGSIEVRLATRNWGNSFALCLSQDGFTAIIAGRGLQDDFARLAIVQLSPLAHLQEQHKLPSLFVGGCWLPDL